MTTQEWDLATLASWRGRDIVAEDGQKLGTLEGLIYDYKTWQPLWVLVGPGIFHPRHVLAPVAAARTDGEVLRVGYTKEHLEHEPPVEIGEGWSYGEDARRLYEYFGLDFARSNDDDIRVLHRHTELPGQERVIGGGSGSPS